MPSYLLNDGKGDVAFYRAKTDRATDTWYALGSRTFCGRFFEQNRGSYLYGVPIVQKI